MTGVSRPPSVDESPDAAGSALSDPPLPAADPAPAPVHGPSHTRAPARQETQEAKLDVPPPPSQSWLDAQPLTRKGKVVVTPPLRGSYDSLVRQNEITEAEGLTRIEDDADLAERIREKLLVPVPVWANLVINQDLPALRRYCRPWTAKFLTDLSRAHGAQFHRPLTVSSAVRTVEYQKRLERVNGNAAPAEGDVVSPHVTGATIDITKDDLSRKQLGWMRSRLLALEQAGKIDVEEEFQQSCFHITVYQSYAPPPPPPAPPAHKGRRRPLATPTSIASLGR